MPTIYHVSHSPSSVHFVEVAEGSSYVTGQPNDETFVVQDDAARRAFELNYTGFRSFNLKDEYEVGEYVTFRNNLYQHLAEKQVLIEDPVDDSQDPIIQTPGNSPGSWELITVPEPDDELIPV